MTRRGPARPGATRRRTAVTAGVTAGVTALAPAGRAA
jgi:hypothetical protein